mmetsp:Transcript_17393/g.54071  ORF Transcript_17393/g.54071 Transcript_17393/m.54071 type:complete len:220 (+) Transcript_17393:1378-2037(+)
MSLRRARSLALRLRSRRGRARHAPSPRGSQRRHAQRPQLSPGPHRHHRRRRLRAPQAQPPRRAPWLFQKGLSSPRPSPPPPPPRGAAAVLHHSPRRPGRTPPDHLPHEWARKPRLQPPPPAATWARVCLPWIAGGLSLHALGMTLANKPPPHERLWKHQLAPPPAGPRRFARARRAPAVAGCQAQLPDPHRPRVRPLAGPPPTRWRWLAGCARHVPPPL